MGAGSSSRISAYSALIALVLAVALPAAVPCTPSEGAHRVSDATTEKNRSERDRCKKSDGTRSPSKDCPDGGERLPQDKRSPLDTIPPLSPLVA